MSTRSGGREGESGGERYIYYILCSVVPYMYVTVHAKR